MAEAKWRKELINCIERKRELLDLNRGLKETNEEQQHVIQDLKRKVEMHKRNAAPKQCLTCTGTVCESAYCKHCLSSAMRGTLLRLLSVCQAQRP